jgi:hypothetical protein
MHYLGRIHQKYALSALENKKHVLLSDPVSISYPAFMKQLEYAKKYGKFVQSSTAFIHQYRVRKFMDCVLSEEQFGRVVSIDAKLSVCPKDLHLVGVNQPPEPLGPNQGCIRRLGRYCVLFGILLFKHLGSRPVSAQVHSASVENIEPDATTAPGDAIDGDNSDEKRPFVREPTKAKCTVKYTHVSTTVMHFSTLAMRLPFRWIL